MRINNNEINIDVDLRVVVGSASADRWLPWYINIGRDLTLIPDPGSGLSVNDVELQYTEPTAAVQLKTIAAASVIISPWTPADGNFQTSPNTAVSSIVELLLTSSSIKGAYSIKLSPLTCLILKIF